MLPLIASSMSASLGCGFSRSSTAADMIWPDWQYPHCGTSFSIHARCSGWLRSDESPSMVVPSLPAARETGVPHVPPASPLRWTVHAPHSAIPQPNFVPVRPKFSRTTHNSGVSGLTSTDCCLPLTFNRIIVCLLDQRETLPQCVTSGGFRHRPFGQYGQPHRSVRLAGGGAVDDRRHHRRLGLGETLWLTAIVFPSLSLNQAVFAPPPVAMPFSVLIPGMSYSSNTTPLALSCATSATTSSTAQNAVLAFDVPAPPDGYINTEEPLPHS